MSYLLLGHLLLRQPRSGAEEGIELSGRQPPAADLAARVPALVQLPQIRQSQTVFTRLLKVQVRLVYVVEKAGRLARVVHLFIYSAGAHRAASPVRRVTANRSVTVHVAAVELELAQR